MTIEQLRNAYKAEPFQPFSLHLADGRQIPVISREFVILSPAGRILIVFQPDDSFNIIGLLLVTDFEFKSPQRENGNGKRRRRS